eukprot:c31530_g1_i1 orf=152-310(-)
MPRSPLGLDYMVFRLTLSPLFNTALRPPRFHISRRRAKQSYQTLARWDKWQV